MRKDKVETKQKIIENVTTLLILKIQFDNQFEEIMRVVENEKWDNIEDLKNSVNRSVYLLGKMSTRLCRVEEILR